MALPTITEASLAAVTAIRDAYMACNAAGDPLEWERTPGISPDPTAMGFLAEAGRAAWRELGVRDADLWGEMIECGEDAAYVYRLYCEGEVPRYCECAAYPARHRAHCDDCSAPEDRCVCHQCASCGEDLRDHGADELATCEREHAAALALDDDADAYFDRLI